MMKNGLKIVKTTEPGLAAYKMVEKGGYLLSDAELKLLLKKADSLTNLQVALSAIHATYAQTPRYFIIPDFKPEMERDFNFPVRGIQNMTDRRNVNMNQDKIQEIVKQVLSQMENGASAPKASAGIPKTSKAAMLTKLENYEIKEFPIPEIGDDEILVKVEGCGVCGTDAHEFKRDPFGLIPLVLGHEGTGEIVKIGKNITKDSAGKPLGVGDKVVTCMIFKDNPDITMFDFCPMMIST